MTKCFASSRHNTLLVWKTLLVLLKYYYDKLLGKRMCKWLKYFFLSKLTLLTNIKQESIWIYIPCILWRVSSFSCSGGSRPPKCGRRDWWGRRSELHCACSPSSPSYAATLCGWFLQCGSLTQKKRKKRIFNDAWQIKLLNANYNKHKLRAI